MLQNWELYTPDDFVAVHSFADNTRYNIQYCGGFDGVPFGAAMHMAKDPPNFLNMEHHPGEHKLYLMFIQVLPEHRGKGHGHALYDCVLQIAQKLGCKYVQQLPSGGYEHQSRADYLLRRGWVPIKGGEMVFHIESQED